MQELLARIEAGGILPPLVVLQVLSKSPSFRLSLVKDYVTRQLQADNRSACAATRAARGCQAACTTCVLFGVQGCVNGQLQAGSRQAAPVALSPPQQCPPPAAANARGALNVCICMPILHFSCVLHVCRSIRADQEEGERLKAEIERTRVQVSGTMERQQQSQPAHQ